MDQLAEWIIEQTSDAVIYADIEGNIQRWNAAATRLFGFSKEEALGHSLNLIIPERLREYHWRGFHAAINSGDLQLSGKPTLTRALSKEHEQPLYVELSFALIRNAQGVVQGSVSIARDVTARVQAEKAEK